MDLKHKNLPFHQTKDFQIQDYLKNLIIPKLTDVFGENVTSIFDESCIDVMYELKILELLFSIIEEISVKE